MHDLEVEFFEGATQFQTENLGGGVKKLPSPQSHKFWMVPNVLLK